MKRILALWVLAMLLLTGADGCPKETTSAPLPLSVLSVRGFAEPKKGQILVSFTGAVSTKSKGKIVLQEGHTFPFVGASRNPFVQDLSYPPGMILSVTLTITAPNTQTAVGCEIIDRGISIVRKTISVEVGTDRGTVVQCGPYTTKS